MTKTFRPSPNMDAGELREYIAGAHGYTLTYGGTSSAWRRANRMVAALAAMTGISKEEVADDLRADYAAMEAAA